MTTGNQCQLCGCNRIIPGRHFLCRDHYTECEAGAIDQCPACGRYKDVSYDVCRDCYEQTVSASDIKRANAGQQGNRGFRADNGADRFFVYALLMNNGEYYIGQTREIHERWREHRSGMSHQTRGRESKLQWFTTVTTRKEATDLEAELQQLNSNPASRREINRWVVNCKKLADELDYEPHNSTGTRTVHERRMSYGGVTPPSSGRQTHGNRITDVLNAFRRRSDT